MTTGSKVSGGDLAVTALYTAATWAWGELPNADLFTSEETSRVFAVTNGVLRLAGLFGNAPPSLRHGLLQRHAILDGAIRDANARQIIELAAGLSRRGATFSEDSAIAYVEVDTAGVVARKQALLARSARGAEVLARANLTFVAKDLVRGGFDDLPVAPGAKLTVVAEGLFVYLNAAEQARLAGEVRRLISRAGAGTFLLDFVPWAEQQRPTRVGRALDGLFRRATQGSEFVRDARGRAEICTMLKSAGFSRVSAVAPQDAPEAWAIPFLDKRTQQLVFIAEA